MTALQAATAEIVPFEALRCPSCRGPAIRLTDGTHCGTCTKRQIQLAERRLSRAPALADLRMPLTAELIRADPPPRRYVLWTADGAGVLVTGKVALLGAKGGTGKSFVLMQLTVAVVLGGCWFGDGGWQAAPGRVLLILGEEESEEAQRRLHLAVKMAGASAEQLELLARKITILPLAGHGVALTTETESSNGHLPETPRAEEIRELLRDAAEEGDPFTLVVLDPLSRFAGGDVEKENGAATRFVQVLETFAAADCGAPAVMVSHHLRKQGKEEATNMADLIRGASGLVDGVRWAAVLGARRRIEGAPALLQLEVPKTNYAKEPAPLVLCRPEDGRGAIRAATASEIEAYEAAAKTPKPSAEKVDRAAALQKRVLEALAAQPMSGRGLAEYLKVRRPDLDPVITSLAADGDIVRTGGRNGLWEVAREVARTTDDPPGGTWHGGTPSKEGGAAIHRGHVPRAGEPVPPEDDS